MAYIDRDGTTAFPFSGEFYTSEIDKTGSMTQWKEKETTIAEVVCDIQEDANSLAGATAKARYEVYVPLDDGADVPVQPGHMFRGTMYGLLVAGKVIGVFPSQVGSFDGGRGYLARVEAVDK